MNFAMHRAYHEMLHVVSFFGAMVSAIGAMNAEKIQMLIGGILAVGGTIWSWWLAQRAKRLDENRRQQMLEDDAAREKRWKDFEDRLKARIAASEAGIPLDSELESALLPKPKATP